MSQDRQPVHSGLVSVAERTCIGCRSRDDQRNLLRVVADVGELIPDMRRRLAGRGAYVHRTRECLDQAQRRKAANRALRVGGELDWSQVRLVIDDHVGSPST